MICGDCATTEEIEDWMAQQESCDPSACIQLVRDQLPELGVFPAWSPNGNRIALSDNGCPGCPASDILVMKSNGKGMNPDHA